MKKEEERVKIDEERIKNWIEKGEKKKERVMRLIDKDGIEKSK